MKKLLIPALGLICATSVFASGKSVPSQLQGSWCYTYPGGYTEKIKLSKTKIIYVADGYYEGKVLSVKNNNGTYLLKTKGKLEDGASDGPLPHSQDFKLKRSGKALLIDGKKHTQCR